MTDGGPMVAGPWPVPRVTGERAPPQFVRARLCGAATSGRRRMAGRSAVCACLTGSATAPGRAGRRGPSGCRGPDGPGSGPLGHGTLCGRGDHPVVGHDQVPGRLGPPGRLGRGSVEGVHAPGHLGVRHEGGLVGGGVRGERGGEPVPVQEQEAVPGRRVGDEAVLTGEGYRFTETALSQPPTRATNLMKTRSGSAVRSTTSSRSSTWWSPASTKKPLARKARSAVSAWRCQSMRRGSRSR